MASSNPVIDEIVSLYARLGSEQYHGEAVSQLQHGLQAAHAAQQSSADEETILAALLHDIGHMIGDHNIEGVGVVDHDDAGVNWLRDRGFSERLVQLVGGHVAAKRFLVATNPSYQERLSATSRKTLELQGGPMTEAEARQFETGPLFKDMLRLRSWDELAKDPEAVVAGLDHYVPMIERHLISQSLR